MIINYNPLLMMLWKVDHNIMIISNFSHWGDNENQLITRAKKLRLNSEKIALMNLQTTTSRQESLLSDEIIELWAKSEQIDYVINYVVGDYEQQFGLENLFRGIQKNLHADQVVMNSDFLINNQIISEKFLNKTFGSRAVHLIPTITEGSMIAKLTAALHKGKVEEYYQLTGGYFSYQGIIDQGKQVGRKINYPTTNVKVSPNFVLKQGVYATINWLTTQETPILGMSCYWINSDGDYLIETNLFDFNQDLYHQVIRTEFVAYLRDLCAVENLDELKVLLKNDEVNSRKKLTGKQNDK